IVLSRKILPFFKLLYSYLLELYKIADMVTHKEMVIIIKSNIILTPSPHSHIACTLHQSLLYSNLYPPCQTLRINDRTLGLFCKPRRVPRICSCESRQPSALFHYYIHCSSLSLLSALYRLKIIFDTNTLYNPFRPL